MESIVFPSFPPAPWDQKFYLHSHINLNIADL
jgi:hypothetical protein